MSEDAGRRFGSIPTGRRLETSDKPTDYMGSIGVLRPATDDAVKLARRNFIEANIDDFERDGMRWTDKATGEAFRVVRAAVLASIDPRRFASVFCVGDGLLWFLRREGDEELVDSLEIGEVGGYKATGREPLSVGPVDIA